MKKAHKYLPLCVEELTERVKSEGTGSTSYELGIRARLPSIAGLARYLDVRRETLYCWKEENDEFSNIFESVMAEQEARLVENATTGRYSPMFSKFLLSAKHGYIEKTGLVGDKDNPVFILSSEIAAKNGIENGTSRESEDNR